MSSLRFRAVFGAALVGAGLVGATACGSAFLDSLTGGDAGGPATGDAARPNIGCIGRIPPDGGNGAPDGPSIGPLSFAFETVRISANPSLDSGAAPPIGLNLDHLCTCEQDPIPSCVPPDAGATPRAAICDGDGGTDDSLASFFNTLSGAVPEFREDFAGQRIHDGIFTVLVDVTDWNGQPEDPKVLVRIRMSPGIDRDVVGRKTPLFDGTDVWKVDPASVVQGSDNLGKDCGPDGGYFCTPTIADSNAFVTNGHLVAHPVNIEGTTPLVLQSSVGRITIDLSNTTLDAVLARTGTDLWKMTGEIDGRWPVQSVLNTIANIENPLQPNTGVCETANSAASLYATLKVGVCSGVDLAATPDLDQNPQTPCTAVSSALSFVASTATPGHIVYNAPSSANCLDWKDDCAH